MSPSPDSVFPALQNFVQAGQSLGLEFMRLLAAGQAAAVDGAAQPSTASAQRARDVDAKVAGDKAASGEDSARAALDTQRLADLQRSHLERQRQLWNAMLLRGKDGVAPPRVEAEAGDRRFAAPEWKDGALFDYVRQSYLLNAAFIRELVELLPATDGKTHDRMRFVSRQLIDAMSPANFAATNPEFIQRAVDTKGRSITDGINNLIRDVGRGRITMTDETAFELGANLATTPGAVVYENDLIQLIQYSPLTKRVGRRPLLIVPPCINKYYILDLQEQNSFVRHAIGEGHTVFLVSWRNVKAEQGHFGWDDYLELGPLTAIARVRAICRVERINVLGFCVGGTLLVSALAVLAARGEERIASLTLLTTLLDFSDAGEIGLFIDETALAARDAAIGKGGILPAAELSSMFSALRANDLIWNYVASSYLLGRTPPAFDLLYWNSDGTNLPGPFACWYMRHLYHENALREPGRLSMCGVSIDVGALRQPTYVLAAREDHIVPWASAYRSAQLLGGDGGDGGEHSRFVVGASGHIAGVVNPANRNRRSYWLNPERPADPEAWLAGASETPGSWWNDWSAWLKRHAGGERAARVTLGNSRHRPIEPAPGRYVKEKA
jgi:polyhydroxyalkanoate synthase